MADTTEQARDPATAGSAAPYPSNFAAWYTVFVLLGIYLNSFLDRQILGQLIGPIKGSMEVSDTQMGLLGGLAFAVLYTLAGLPLGWLADRMSRRLLVGVGQVFWSMASMGFGLAKSYPQMLAARIGVGIGEASLSPSAYSMLADSFPPHRLGRALSVYGMGIFLGGGLADVVGAYAMRWLNVDEAGQNTASFPIVGEIFAWQVIFFLIALPTIPLTLLLLTVREPVRRGVLRAPAAAGDAPPAAFLSYMRKNIKTVLCHNVGFAFLSFSGYGAAFWLTEFYVRTHGWDRADTAEMRGYLGMAAGAAGIFCGGWLGDTLTKKGYTDAKMRVGLLSSVAWLPFGIAVPLVSDGWLSFLLLAPATFIGAAVWGIAPAAIQEIMPNQMRGQASALYLFILNMIGLGLGPTTVGWLTDSVFQDESKLNLSLLTATLVSHLISTSLLWLGLSHFRRSRAELVRMQGAD